MAVDVFAGGSVGTTVGGVEVNGASLGTTIGVADVAVGIAGVLSPQAARTDPATPAAPTSPTFFNSVRRDNFNRQLLLKDDSSIVQF